MPANLCAQIGANTGEILCDKSKAVMKKPFIFNGSVANVATMDSDTFLAALAGKSKLSKLATEKIFPLPELQDIARNGEGNVTGSLGLGFTTVLREGRPGLFCKILWWKRAVKAIAPLQ
jgi:predicted pyridoxine 5'-phosphate oxidase superfamily flavin-nucleotide-binding protein